MAIFDNKKLENHVVTIQMTRNRCFPLVMEDLKVNALKATVEDNAWDWHKRVGHLDFCGLHMLVNKAKETYGVVKVIFSWKAS